jgi:hypothetical protein
MGPVAEAPKLCLKKSDQVARRYILADPREKLNFLCFLKFRFRFASNPVQLFHWNQGHDTIARRPGMGCIHNGMDDPVRS